MVSIQIMYLKTGDTTKRLEFADALAELERLEKNGFLAYDVTHGQQISHRSTDRPLRDDTRVIMTPVPMLG